MTDRHHHPPCSAPDVSLLLHDPEGGVRRVLVNLANAFSAEGMRVHVLATNWSGRPPDLEAPVGFSSLETRGVRDLLWPLVRYLRRARPRALLSAMEHPNLVAVAARALARVPTRLVLTVHGPLTPRLDILWGPRERALLPRLMKHAYPRADAVVGVSRGVSQDLEARIPTLRGRVRTIYNPILPARGFPDAPVQAPLPFADFDGPVLISAGRFAPPKQYPLLLRAFARAAREREMRLVLLGDGPPRPALEALARELGVAERVAMPGMVPNPHVYMRQAHLFVLSSSWEGFGNVLVEAMACGTPVLSTDCPFGPGEILDGGRFGRLVPPGDEDALARGILASLDDPVDRATLVARAQAFSIARSAAAYRALLEGPSPS